MALQDIDTIIIVIMENRSFDHVLGYLSLPGAGQMSVEGLQAGGAWLDAHANIHNGVVYRSTLLDPAVQTIDDPSHSRETIAVQINTPPQGGGLMGGFVTSYADLTTPAPTDPSQAMGYYDAAAVPIFDFFARNFVVCDHWFSALPAGTQPNRLMAMAGESQISENGGLLLPHQYLVYDWLTDHHIDWCAYQWGGYFPFFSLDAQRLPEILESLTLTPGSGSFRRYSHFASQWASSDAMPQVIFIEPEYGDGPHDDPNDDHPPTGIAKGQAFLADIYTTLISNPARWAKTMMIVTYDEHGGFFDHAPPLAIPQTVGAVQFETTGVRVPAFVISPQVASGGIFNANLDHTAILQLLDDKFAPGEGYSVSVNARQGYIDRISNTLEPMPASPRTPEIEHATASALRAVAATSPLAPQLGASPADPPNARAFHQVALKAATDHADLLARPEWASVRSYLASAR
jgi:phospholipase C